MSTFKNPVGPQPSKVYWRRRLVALLALLVFILVIVMIVSALGRANADGAASPINTTTSTPKAAGSTPKPTTSSTAKPITAEPEACATGDVKLVAVTDASSYGSDTDPKLSLTLTNTSDAACTIEAGSDVQKYTITSGKDLIWSSTDCQTKPVASTVTLEPGKALASDPFAWDRTRSDPKTCDSTRDKVTADGASYHLDVTVGKITSTDSKQFILK